MKDKQLATDADVQTDARIGPSQFYIIATPRPGVKVEDLEHAVDDEIAAAVKDGVTADELAKAKAQALRQFIDRRQSVLSTAIRMADFTVYFNDPNLINTWQEKIQAVTADQVHEVAQKHLVRDQRTVVITLPAAEDAAGKGGS